MSQQSWLQVVVMHSTRGTRGAARAAGRDAEQPWNNSEEMEVRHSAWARPAEFAAAAEAAAMVATATNRTADVLGLPNGAPPLRANPVRLNPSL